MGKKKRLFYYVLKSQLRYTLGGEEMIIAQKKVYETKVDSVTIAQFIQSPLC